jgi:hypothetical protein
LAWSRTVRVAGIVRDLESAGAGLLAAKRDLKPMRELDLVGEYLGDDLLRKDEGRIPDLGCELASSP